MKHSKYYYFRLFWVKAMRAGQRTGCHQLPERSFFFRQYQFPVCARCCGVFVGQITALVLLCFGIIVPLYMGFLFAFIMFVDWGIQYLGILESNNFRRLISGVLGGIGTWSIVINLICYLFNLIIK